MNDDVIDPRDPSYNARIAWLIIEMVLNYFDVEFATTDGTLIDDVLVLQPASDEFEIH